MSDFEAAGKKPMASFSSLFATHGCVSSCNGHVCGGDGCGGSCGTCDSPPSSTCSGTTRVYYTGAGVCAADGSCDYTAGRQEQDCAASGLVCRTGECATPGGTTIGENIRTDTVLTASASPYVLSADIAVYEDVKLTIEPGVVILGQGHELSVYGGVHAVGTSASWIVPERVQIVPGPNTPHYDMTFQFVDFRQASLYSRCSGTSSAYAQNGTLALRDSKVTGLSCEMLMYFETGSCDIERNVFVDSAGIGIGTKYDVVVSIRNNVFVNWRSPNGDTFAIENLASLGNSKTIVERNSFLDVGRVAVRLPVGYASARMTAINNDWGTTDSSVIQAMIFDKNDSPGSGGYIAFSPYLSAPDASTPVYP